MFNDFINTKAKPFIVFLFSIIALCIFAISTQAAMIICSSWYGIAAGIIFMLLAICLHNIARKISLCYIYSFMFNIIGCGFSVSAYYSSYEISINIYEMFFAALPAASILLLVYIILQAFRKTKKAAISITVILNILLLCPAVYFWIRTDPALFSFLFFCLLLSLFYLCVFGITVNHDERSVLSDVSYGSFGTFVILTVVVIVILSEGEFLEELDFFSGWGSGKKKEINKICIPHSSFL